ncbi:TolC family protein [Dyadobacter luteus]|uniref:TolC family protein n=1 Tax=Dyadobacter luteus TaxID=2259619 RepID=A0A3D8YBH1_9BACT|nr:efflux transporter outer membrane subunit [Dyadobacter luteus]REA61360.1 TolC family protein [Dyadobacter luteus]
MRTYKIYPVLIASALVVSSCKLSRPVPQTPVQTPETFIGHKDSTGIGDIPWKTFFTDQNLVAVIDTAIQNNLDLKMAVQRIEMAQSNVLFAKGALLPVVDVEISGGGRKFGDYTMDGVGNYDTNFSPNLDDNRKLPAPFLPDYFAGLRSSWEVDIWGKLKTQRKAAFTRFLASEKARQAITTSLVANVASLYFELINLDTELNIIKKNINLQKTAVETIGVQKEAGRANELAVRQFKAQLLNTQSLEIDVNQRIIAAENQLNLLLGRFPQKITRSTVVQQSFPQQVQAGIPTQMLRNRPDVKQAELEMLANYEDQHAARLAFMPSLNITAMLGFNAFKSSLIFNPGSIAYNALGGLTAPLLNRKALKAGQKRAEAASLESLYNYNKSILTGFQEVSTSLNRIENSRKITEFKREEVAVLQQAVTTSRDLFVTGYATYLEIITAQKSVLEAELTLANVQTDQYLALIELYRSVGGGWK